MSARGDLSNKKLVLTHRDYYREPAGWLAADVVHADRSRSTRRLNKQLRHPHASGWLRQPVTLTMTMTHSNKIIQQMSGTWPHGLGCWSHDPVQKESVKHMYLA